MPGALEVNVIPLAVDPLAPAVMVNSLNSTLLTVHSMRSFDKVVGTMIVPRVEAPTMLMPLAVMVSGPALLFSIYEPEPMLIITGLVTLASVFAV